MLFKVFNAVGLVHAEGRLRCFGAKSKTLPNFALFVFIPAKQHGSGIATGWHHQGQTRLGFGKAGEVIKITVGTEGIIGIAISHHFHAGLHQRNTTAHLLQTACQLLSALGVNEGIVGRVPAHANASLLNSIVG